MKVRFMSKKQREDRKNRKQQEVPVTISPKQQAKQVQSMKEETVPINPSSQVEIPVLKAPQLTKKQQQQHEQLKKNYLGLIPQQKSQRHQKNYKSKLLFQWDAKDDTSGGGVLADYISKGVNVIYENKLEGLTMEKSWKEKKFEEMSDRDWRIFREDMQIYVKGGRVVNPFRQWNELDALDNRLLNNLEKLKFKKPKPIQMQAIPIGLTRKDMVALAPTGEGKTLAYLIPLIHFVLPLERLNSLNSETGPYGIVFVPSRELAQQIVNQFQKIDFGEIKMMRIVGQMPIDLQAVELQKGYDILVSTPGRLRQLVEKHYLSLRRCSWVVIDEADKMISENMIEDIEWLFQAMGEQSLVRYESEGKRRITHMFSATMVPQIEKLTKKYLVAPVNISIGQIGGGKKQIEQSVELLDENHKSQALRKILRGLPGPIMIFVNTRVKCDKIVKMVQVRFERTCADYHGGKNQESRQRIIQDFRNGKFEVLVTTDLGGRGLDIKGVNAVISYDAPKNISEFIHRAGRTGRAGAKGKAFTFLTAQDQDLFYDVKTFMERNDFKIPQNLREHPSAQVKPGTAALIARKKQIVYTN